MPPQIRPSHQNKKCSFDTPFRVAPTLALTCVHYGILQTVHVNRSVFACTTIAVSVSVEWHRVLKVDVRDCNIVIVIIIIAHRCICSIHVYAIRLEIIFVHHIIFIHVHCMHNYYSATLVGLVYHRYAPPNSMSPSGSVCHVVMS